ncbi:MAG: hypothetical protein KJ622_00060 [Alphaproteobacteria bacterium]|nr:hypothetical protein [Alphaproteobacteria bacterium]
MERFKSVTVVPVEMSSDSCTSKPARGRARTARLPASLEAKVTRYSAPVRRELRRLVRLSPRFADLIDTFPAAAYALATRRGSNAIRDDAIRLVIDGASLKAVARKLELPNWLKKLPPEAFDQPLGQLPQTESFARRVASRLPNDPLQAPFWLESVAFASKAGHDEFAIWLAEQRIYADRGDAERTFKVLAAFAWFSRAPHCEAKDLIVVPWRPEIAFDTALCAAKSWLNRLRLIMQLQPHAGLEPWLDGGEALGYSFAPLIDRDALLKEAQAMQNCADQYAERLARERCRLFSVKKGLTHVATLEIGPHSRESGVLSITQLKARHNMPASVEIWQAAHLWMSQQAGLKRMPPMIPPERPFDEKTWRRLMAPYRAEKDGAPWLPKRLTQTSFLRMDMDMCDLARRAGVTSWLFT